MSKLKMMKDLVSRMKPGEDTLAEKILAGNIVTLVLRAKDSEAIDKAPALLWIHGGGYFVGMKEMVYMGRAAELVGRHKITVFSPGYRLAIKKPYPAALKDCWTVLKYMIKNADDLGIDKERIMIGGESAGGGLCAALCMMARDRGEVKIFFQMPLYPMLDCEDTESSRDNHSMFWNTKKNHEAWKLYLGDLWGSENVPPYASPSRQKDYSGLPPCYTFVADGEPFLCETVKFVEDLKKAGVPAKVDVFSADQHAFDAFFPWKKASKDARAAFLKNFGEAIGVKEEEKKEI